VSRPDRSGAVQIDAEHPSRNRKVVGSNPTSGSKIAGQRPFLALLTVQRQQAVIRLGWIIAPQARPLMRLRRHSHISCRGIASLPSITSVPLPSASTSTAATSRVDRIRPRGQQWPRTMLVLPSLALTSPTRGCLAVPAAPRDAHVPLRHSEADGHTSDSLHQEVSSALCNARSTASGCSICGPWPASSITCNGQP
jgi:hypothetical protein